MRHGKKIQSLRKEDSPQKGNAFEYGMLSDRAQKN